MFRKLGRYRAAVSAGALALVLGSGVAIADTGHSAHAHHDDHHAVAQADSHGAAHGADEHHGGHGDHHDPAAPPPPMNFWKGLLGEKDGVEESLLWRNPGTPPPFLATLFNFSVFVFLIVRFGAKPLAEALKKRKETIMRDIDEAQRMREASETRLKEYELRLEKIEEELERVRREFREAGERERERILADANERRERMKKDAEFLLSQELKQMRQDLLHETVDQALLGAAELLRAKLTPAEQDRYLEALLLQLPARSGSAKGADAIAAKGGLS